MHTTYIGIDPSLTHTGLIALDERGKQVFGKAIVTKPAAGWKAQVFRQEHVVRTVYSYLLQITDPANMILFIENYAPGRYINTIIPQCELGGLLRAMIAHLPNLPADQVVFVPPATLKKFATGKGNSGKVGVATAITTRFHVDFGNDDNMYDAYTLARLAMAWDGHCDKLTQVQIEVAAKLRKDGLNGKT